MIIVPLVLLVIFIILYIQFKSITTSLMIFFGIAMALSGGFILMGLYHTDWFLNFYPFWHPYAGGLSNTTHQFECGRLGRLYCLIWHRYRRRGLNGYLFESKFPKKRSRAPSPRFEKLPRKRGLRRIRPAVMTTATTLIALLPILTSSGRGSDIMIPMAIPIFGGMVIASITYFIVPVLYSWKKEIQLKKGKS